MGFVTEKATTGDNDPELFPTEYNLHYMYCDRCGSFDIKPWIEPNNHAELTKVAGHIERFVFAAIISGCLALVVCVLSLLMNWIQTKTVFVSLELILWLVISVLAFFIFQGWAQKFEEKVHFRGVKCLSCKSQYANGSSSLTETTHNPREYALSDVPMPRNTTYSVRS